MPGAIMFGRTVEFSPTASNGTNTDGVKVFSTICTQTLPVIKRSRAEVEATTTCSGGKEYVPGMPEGSEFTLTGVFQGKNDTAYGISTSSLRHLAELPQGSIVAFRDTTTQWGADDVVHRFDVALLDVEFGGGGLEELQTWSVRGRITNKVDYAAA